MKKSSFFKSGSGSRKAFVSSFQNEKELNEKIKKITETINMYGFETAAIKFSISDTSKIGGNIGKIKENQLSKNLKKEIQKLKVNEFSKTINNNPEKYFTKEILDQINEAAKNEFLYGNTIGTDDSKESDT